MAFHAVLEVADAFFQMLRTDLRLGVLVASVAGIAAVVTALVAGVATGLVVAIEHEMPVVFEGRRLPGCALVALPAFAVEIAVNAVLGRGVA